MTTRYRANAPRFVDETLDGEVLIIDMVNGTYFSATGASAFVWSAVSAGATTADVAERLSAARGIEPERARRDVEELVEQLVGEELLVPRDPSDPPVDIEAGGIELADIVGVDEGLAYERFTDLADLILLDPVHDVSAAGWPNPLAAPTTE